MPRKPKNSPIVAEHFSWYLRQKPSGVYYADGRINSNYKLGKPSLGTRDREEALRRLWALDRKMAVQHGLIDADTKDKPRDVAIEEGWGLYMERCAQPEILGGVGPRSYNRYGAMRDKHVKFCAKKGYTVWSAITKKTTNEYGDSLAKKKYADSTIVGEMNLVCSVSKWLIEEGYLAESFRFQLKLSKPEGSNTYCYTKKEFTQMVRYCHANSKLEWLAQVLIGLATSGLRVGELAKLRWTDIDFPSNTICLTDERSRPRRRQTGKERRIKGKRGRALPIHPALRNVLKTLPRRVDGLVFHGQKGGKLDPRRVLEALQGRVIENLKSEFPVPDGEIGFADGTVHSLRHYFCSEAYRNGATDAELLEWLGHRDSKIMSLYRHLRSEDGQRRMEQIDFLDGDDEETAKSNVA